jgi:predicted aconitase with swiveling domain/8-oxo-dGTP pyrophosphatase MutT (NUDIX family)
MRGRRIKAGVGRGKALVSMVPISFLGGVDPVTGKVLDTESEAAGESVSGTVLCFPYGKGSTVGSYSMYQLKLNGEAPAAIVNSSAEPIVATGAIMADIPMVDRVDVSLFRKGDDIIVDASEGTVEVVGVEERHVVTNILLHKGKVLLLRRSNSVGSFRGKWAGVSGFIEAHEEAEEAARRELAEEAGLKNAKLLRCIETERFRDGQVVWCVHPFLFETKSASIKMDWEHQAYEWVSRDDIGAYPTVPGLQRIVCRLLEK